MRESFHRQSGHRAQNSICGVTVWRTRVEGHGTDYRKYRRPKRRVRYPAEPGMKEMTELGRIREGAPKREETGAPEVA